MEYVIFGLVALIIILFLILIPKKGKTTYTFTKTHNDTSINTNGNPDEKIKSIMEKMNNDIFNNGEVKIDNSIMYKGHVETTTIHTDSEGKVTKDVEYKDFNGKKDNRCPSCGATNSSNTEECSYCHSKLK